MELLLSEEQALLKESAAALAARHGGPSRLRALRDAGETLDREAWGAVAAAGWLGLLVEEDEGGAALGATAFALAIEQAGRALMMAPIAAACAAARAIGAGDSDTLRGGLLGDVLAGRTLVVPALQEGLHALDVEAVATRAAADGDGWRLSGRKDAVPGLATVDGVIVDARTGQGTVLCYLPRGADGCVFEAAPTVDGEGLGTVRLDGAAVPRAHVVAGANRAAGLAAGMQDALLVGTCAELLGVMDKALETAVEYTKVRNQFDRPIGSFQALQHRAVNDYVAVEVTRSLLFQTAAALDEGRATAEMVAVLKAKASGAALSVTKSAIQMHGAIGFTDEHDIGLYFKRAMALSSRYGNEAASRRRYARLAGIES